MSERGEVQSGFTDPLFDLEQKCGVLDFDPDDYLSSPLFQPKPESSEVELSDGVGRFLKEAGKYQLLKHQDEIKLAKLIERGQFVHQLLGGGEAVEDERIRQVLTQAEQARSSFIHANLRMVAFVYRKRFSCPPGMEEADLLQEGVMGLSMAVDRFEYQRGFKFSTFAHHWVRQTIGRAIESSSTVVKLPVNKAASLYAAMRDSVGSEGLSDEHFALLAVSRPISLARPLDGDSEFALEDTVSDLHMQPDEEALSGVLHSDIMSILTTFSELDQQLIMRRNGLHGSKEWNFRELGEFAGLTTEGARQKYVRAMERLRDQVTMQYGESLLSD